jgi:hypothetical protein
MDAFAVIVLLILLGLVAAVAGAESRPEFTADRTLEHHS